MSKTTRASSPPVSRRSENYPPNLSASLQTTFLHSRTHQWVYSQKMIRKSSHFSLVLFLHNRQLHLRSSSCPSTPTPGPRREPSAKVYCCHATKFSTLWRRHCSLYSISLANIWRMAVSRNICLAGSFAVFKYAHVVARARSRVDSIRRALRSSSRPRYTLARSLRYTLPPQKWSLRGSCSCGVPRAQETLHTHLRWILFCAYSRWVPPWVPFLRPNCIPTTNFQSILARLYPRASFTHRKRPQIPHRGTKRWNRYN